MWKARHNFLRLLIYLISLITVILIKALGGVNKPIESNFYSFGVSNEIRKIENITGEKYTYEGGGVLMHH